MEILNKSKSLDEVLAVLGEEDQATLLATFDLMKAKLGGSIDTMDTQDNGQWSLQKNTINYKEMNAPKNSKEPTRTIDYKKMNAPKPSNKEPANTLNYSDPEFKPAAAGGRNDAKPKSWDGAVARRDAARAKHQKWVDEGSQNSGETDDKNALDAMKDRRIARNAKKSEDETTKSEGKPGNKSEKILQDIKDKYADKKPKPLNEAVREAKEAYYPKPPKSDNEKADDAKRKYREESKLKAEEPFKNSIKISENKTRRES